MSEEAKYLYVGSEATNEEAKYCDSCGCCMQYTTIDGSKINIIAFNFSLSIDEFLANQVLGPFPNKEYNICYECILRALGVMP